MAKEISGQETTARGILSKLKSALGFGEETDRWLTLASVDNPLLEQTDRLAILVMEKLTRATGVAITESDLAISVVHPVHGNSRISDLKNNDQKQTISSTQNT